MTRQIAFLRGINVGGKVKVDMAGLREILTGLGFTGVRTHLNSGNALFDAKVSTKVAAKRIEDAIAERYGRPIPVLVRTRDELAAVIDAHPLRDVATDPAKFVACFLNANPDPALVDQIDPTEFEPELFRVGDRVLYLWCPNGLADTKFLNTFFEKRLKVVATARNWNTVTKLLALADSA